MVIKGLYNFIDKLLMEIYLIVSTFKINDFSWKYLQYLQGSDSLPLLITYYKHSSAIHLQFKTNFNFIYFI